MYPQGMPMTSFPSQNLLAGMNVNQYMEYYKMMELAMYQQMFKNEQLKGMGFPNMAPQMMQGMMPASSDLINLKQNLYQNYMRRTMPQQGSQAPIPPRNAPIYDLTEVFLTKK